MRELTHLQLYLGKTLYGDGGALFDRVTGAHKDAAFERIGNAAKQP